MRVYRQEKKRLPEFLRTISTGKQLIAPVKKDVVRFLPVSDVSDIYLGRNAFFPVKEYFFHKEETLFRFSGNKIEEPKIPEPARVFFGLRRCDLAAIKHQDLVYETIKDPYYLAARKNSVLIGYHCNEAPSPYCFCGSLKLADHFDLMFYDRGDYFLVEVGSEKGQNIVDKNAKLFVPHPTEISADEKIIKGAERLKNPDISKLYDRPEWKKGVDLCLSCTACTALCPTCYCFSIHDELKLPPEGERKRVWSSCQLQEFSRVAGDHIYRKERTERFKHRIYHQLDYFKERYGVTMCVGCGRCIEGCPTRIDFVEIINGMKK